MYIIFTDGACKGNPGPGGIGYLIKHPNGAETEFSGHEPMTTNNRMELLAPVFALSELPQGSDVTIITDSQYVKNGITQWIINWKKNGWKTAQRKPVKNDDLWRLLDEAVSQHNVTWEWVKGHSDHPENDRVDQLAQRGARNE